MSELLDSYIAQIPDKCRDCPVVVAAIDNAVAQEEYAGNVAEELDTKLEKPDFTIDSVVRDLMTQLEGQVLTVYVEREAGSLSHLKNVVERTAGCSGSKRGGYDYEPISWKISKYIKKERACRRPSAG